MCITPIFLNRSLTIFSAEIRVDGAIGPLPAVCCWEVPREPEFAEIVLTSTVWERGIEPEKCDYNQIDKTIS